MPLGPSGASGDGARAQAGHGCHEHEWYFKSQIPGRTSGKKGPRVFNAVGFPERRAARRLAGNGFGSMATPEAPLKAPAPARVQSPGRQSLALLGAAPAHGGSRSGLGLEH